MLTYGYVLSVPLIVVFSVCLTILKYRYGYIQLLNGESESVDCHETSDI